ncbi:hypothetical protein VTJ83DRAFT_1508 [Remersonia thermophila]|uniref:chitinase n=1 Tax=Remersonia thermophila TaxID=72144 RepID=A0ABR4DIG7_9PEZI
MRLPSSIRAPAAALLAWSAIAGQAAAQVTTDCFPMNQTCPPNPALSMDLSQNFNATPNINIWETKIGPITYDINKGALFRLTKQGDAPTLVSRFYYFWGRTEIHMKAARGRGIISSVMMLSDNLDEIDWEFFGTNSTVAQTNYYGKGVIPDISNGEYHTVPGNVHDDYHNYTTVWTKDFLDFYYDGQRVRRLVAEDANNTYFYPQTPMRLYLGIWAGGDPRLPKGTREWAGGDTDYTQGPFDMWVKSVHVTDFSSGKEYEYMDRSGSWESIKIHEGNSTVFEILNAPPEKTLAEKWNELPEAAKIAVYAGASGFVGLLVFSALFYCIRQRRRGAREAKAAEARAEAERLELERFKKAGVDPDSFASTASEYNAKEMRAGGLADADSYSVPPSPSMHATTPASPLDGNLSGGPPPLAAAALARGNMHSPGPQSPLLPPGSPHGPPPPGSPHGTPPGYYPDRQANQSPAPSMGSGPRSPTYPPNRNYTGSPGPRSPTFPPNNGGGGGGGYGSPGGYYGGNGGNGGYR